MVSFDVKCKCGEYLEAYFIGSALEVEPCGECLGNAKSDGYDEGYTLAGEEYAS